MLTKDCTKCGEKLPATNEYFPKQKQGKYGLRADCKKCRIEATNKWIEQNPEKAKESTRRWIFENKERHLENANKWRKNNPEKVKEFARKSYEKIKKDPIKLEERLKKAKEWTKNNPEKIREIHKRSYLKNIEYHRQYYRNKRKSAAIK